jgi:hypothetical protein
MTSRFVEPWNPPASSSSTRMVVVRECAYEKLQKKNPENKQACVRQIGIQTLSPWANDAGKNGTDHSQNQKGSPA